MNTLPPAPTHIETFKEIAVVYNQKLTNFYNALTPQERVFIYYLFRASLPGNRIASDQLHRDALTIKEIFQTIYMHKALLLDKHKDTLPSQRVPKVDKFIQELKTFLVYLWSNHSHYFARECANEKRTPGRLGLATLTKENIAHALELIDRKDLLPALNAIEKSLFDHSYEPSIMVPNSIESSAVNTYAPDFTEQDYKNLTPQERDRLNAYFYVEKKSGLRQPIMVPYALNGRYAEELTITVFWLNKALELTSTIPDLFDMHLVKSLEFLIEFLKTGDEEFFRKHSIEWLKSSSRIDYNLGFIETYHDPKEKRGFFQAEATIKTIDLAKLNKILPSIEQSLPMPNAFKRDLSKAHVIPNASINTKVFGTGGLGPMLITAAYCLPNYEDIRIAHGSKQIIYPATKCLGALVNPVLSHKLFFLKKESDWLEEHDPQWKFFNDLWDMHCILHETLGHGSGKLAKHTFKEGDPLIICGKQYAVGDTIEVTNENITELLGGYEQTLEELRAEIIALYVSINHLDELIKLGFFKKWIKKLSHEELAQWLLFHMTDTGLVRIIQQNDTATEITGAHAQANMTIMNFLIKHGGIALKEESLDIDEINHTVLGLTVLDMEKARNAVTVLMNEVQRIKSTGDGQAAKQLINTYGRELVQRHLTLLKANEKKVTGDLKARVYIAPHFIPIVDNSGTITDIQAEWPKNIFEQFTTYAELELSEI